MVVAFANDHRFAAKQQVTLYDIAEEHYIDRLKCEIREPFFQFMNEHDLNLQVACSSQREDWIQELVIRGLGVSVMPRYSITTRRIGWRTFTGPLSKSRNIMIARADGISSQPCADKFFSDATNFQWQNVLQELQQTANAS